MMHQVKKLEFIPACCNLQASPIFLLVLCYSKKGWNNTHGELRHPRKSRSSTPSRSFGLARSELWIFGYLRNYEGRQNSGKNTRETERDRSNLGGALAPLGGTTAKDQRGEPLPI
ncbi:hypothetical protein D1007_19530 [Hordeum vulgare]|nr:hypothetical protein D1007_19530 [Hordeum vulgare]